MPVRATAGTNHRINALWRRLSKIVSPAARAATPPPPPSGCAGRAPAASGPHGHGPVREVESRSHFLAQKPRRDQRQHLRLLRTEPQTVHRGLETSVRAGGMRRQRSEHTLVVVRECPRAVRSQVRQTNDASFAGERKVHRGAQESRSAPAPPLAARRAPRPRSACTMRAPSPHRGGGRDRGQARRSGADARRAWRLERSGGRGQPARRESHFPGAEHPLVTTAVACGDLSRKITVPAQGEILELKETVNEMVDQLRELGGRNSDPHRWKCRRPRSIRCAA